jgi:hypothetical protein
MAFLCSSESLNDKEVSQVTKAWQAKGHQHVAPGMVMVEGEPPRSIHTFRRKPKSYAPQKAERNELYIPPSMIEELDAAGGKKKGGGKKGKAAGGKKKK